MDTICTFVSKHPYAIGLSIAHNKFRDESLLKLATSLRKTIQKVMEHLDISGTMYGSQSLKELLAYIQVDPRFNSLHMADTEMNLKFLAGTHLGRDLGGKLNLGQRLGRAWWLQRFTR